MRSQRRHTCSHQIFTPALNKDFVNASKIFLYLLKDNQQSQTGQAFHLKDNIRFVLVLRT